MINAVCSEVSIPVVARGGAGGIDDFIELFRRVNVDAGLGAPSHAAAAMELGADAVLVNTAIAVAGDPERMARAFARAVEAGREAYESGLGAQARCAEASSPLTSFLD